MLINLPICKLYNLGENQIEIHSDYFFPKWKFCFLYNIYDKCIIHKLQVVKLNGSPSGIL